MSVESINERDVVLRFQMANTPDALAALVRDPNAGDERALRIYLGDDQFNRLNALAQSLGQSRGLSNSLGNIVVLPGIMGSELSVNDQSQKQTLVWFNLIRAFGGWLPYLALADDGENPFGTHVGTATNIINKYYGEMVLHLSQHWNARAFWYDWRKSLRRAATDLEHFLRSTFLDQEVTVVAHSMGGLVVRTLLASASPPLAANGKPLIKRLVMLGTPNYGSFEVPLIFSGIQDSVRQIIKLTGGLKGVFNSAPARKSVLELLDSFPGIYQMLPSPDQFEGSDKIEVERLFKPSTYAAFNASVSRRHLAAALEHHKLLAAHHQSAVLASGQIADMVYVAGYAQPTVVKLETADDLSDPDNYVITDHGDGRVPHSLGLLQGVDTFYVRCSHGDLPRNPEVIAAIDDLAERGTTRELLAQIPPKRGVVDVNAIHRQWVQRFERPAQEREDEEIAELVRRLERSGCVSRSGAPAAPPAFVTRQEQELEERVVAPFLGSNPSTDSPRSRSGTMPSIRVSLEYADIKDCHRTIEELPPVDAIAVGVYSGVRPCGAVRVLDQSISEAICGPAPTGEPGVLVLTQLIEGGTILAQLGSPFLFPDPRVDVGTPDQARVIALAGLGAPGRCGAPELTIASRELCWTINCLGKQHLATLAIGAGEGNVEIEKALLAFFRGVARAYEGTANAAISNEIGEQPSNSGVPWNLRQITVFEYYGDRLLELADALPRVQKQLIDDRQLFIDVTLSAADIEVFERLKHSQEVTRLTRQLEHLKRFQSPNRRAVSDSAAARVVFSLYQDVYRFSAVTNDASIPERTVEVNTRLVEQANDLLVAADNSTAQKRLGRMLGHLLIPKDLRKHFQPQMPLVMAVDSRSARIHWEMVVAEDGQGGHNPVPGEFLGLERGFTRQLRTGFAPPPEPPPAARRTLKVLVVADPAPDARLKGAYQEATEVAELFERFNNVYRSNVCTEVTRLIGPSRATQIEVMGELLLESYDVLHYAGHCMFNVKEPPKSGWIFGLNPLMILSSFELRRIDRVPRFVFSNACESGITPDRPETRNAELSPSFAEVFFDRGVANFICTAWPVDDAAARIFARTLYAGLLGLQIAAKPSLEVQGPRPPLPLYRAMQEARQAVARMSSGMRTWGAYQHYGSPHARFFAADIQQHARPQYQSTDDSSPTAPQSHSADVSTLTATDAAHEDRFVQVRKAISDNGARLLATTQVLDVRPGFKYTQGWSTGRPAMVVVVRQKLPPEQVPADQLLPGELDGVPVDVAPATPLEQLGESRSGFESGLSDSERLLRPGEVMTISEELIQRRIPYVPPTGVELTEIKDVMRVDCHVSPEEGWNTLNAFIKDTQKQLTVGIYDISARHVVDRLSETLKANRRKLRMVVDPGLALTNGGDPQHNPKANDITEDNVRDQLHDALKQRLHFVWAAVKRQGKVSDGIFPTSYHIKVAVRDSEAFWLSSGNMQSTNQPAEQTLSDLGLSWNDPRRLLQTCNREWHVIVQHQGLAQVFESFLEHDFDNAEPLQAEGRGLPVSIQEFPDLLIPEGQPEQRSFVTLKRFPNKSLPTDGKPVRVQPLLTPDNYADHVLRLIRSAKKSILFQNQYINLSASPHPKFHKLIAALKTKMVDEGLDVRIILRDLPNTRAMLEALEAEGFDMQHIRTQKATHTKGIIVDDGAVLIGSHNWSSFGTTQNRDASLLFFHSEIAAYYKEVFEHDWNGLARGHVSAERSMPLVVNTARGVAPEPEGTVRIPWSAIYED